MSQLPRPRRGGRLRKYPERSQFLVALAQFSAKRWRTISAETAFDIVCLSSRKKRGGRIQTRISLKTSRMTQKALQISKFAFTGYFTILDIKIIVSNFFPMTALRKKKCPLLSQTLSYMVRNQEKPHLQDFTISKAYSLHRSCYNNSWPYSSMFVIKVGTFFLKVVMENQLDNIIFTSNTYFWQLQQ